MQILVEAAKWIGVAFTLAVAIGLLVIAVFSWLLNRPDPP
jgi:hypothetical protein